jgi:hypothetical protein
MHGKEPEHRIAEIRPTLSSASMFKDSSNDDRK